jgi:23S rRNA (pseudouridine1915-N3)-methyltransferase
MRIRIAAVGQRQPRWVDEAVADYLARFPAGFEVTLREVRPEARAGIPAGRALAAEAARLRAALPDGGLIVALDERGRDWTTRQFADALAGWRDAAETPAFVIGGADGLDPELKSSARLSLRLSSLTLPHGLARVLLVEQIYRAWSILAGHPYHRA